MKMSPRSMWIRFDHLLIISMSHMPRVKIPQGIDEHLNTFKTNYYYYLLLSL